MASTSTSLAFSSALQSMDVSSVWDSLRDAFLDGPNTTKKLKEDIVFVRNARRQIEQLIDQSKDKLTRVHTASEDGAALEELGEQEDEIQSCSTELDAAMAHREGQLSMLGTFFFLAPMASCLVGAPEEEALVSKVERYSLAVEEFKQKVEYKVSTRLQTLNSMYQGPVALSEVLQELKQPPRSPVYAPTACHVMIYGAAGTGKSSLTRRLVEIYQSDIELREMYPDGVVRVEFGRGPAEWRLHQAFLLMKLMQLEALLDSSIVNVDFKAGDCESQLDIVQNLAFAGQEVLDRRLTETQTRIRSLLTARRFLLVLDDLWPGQKAILRSNGLLSTFDGGCVVTSRTDLGRALTHGRVHTRGFVMNPEPRLCEAILCAYAYNDWQDTTLKVDDQVVGHQILKRCGRSPMALRLVGSVLQRGDRSWKSALESLGPIVESASRMGFSDGCLSPIDAMKWAVDCALDQAGSSREDMQRMLGVLKLLPAATNVPVGVLRAIWMDHPGASLEMFKLMLHKLVGASLVDRHARLAPAESEDVRVHGLLLECLHSPGHSLCSPRQLSFEDAATEDALDVTAFSKTLIATCCQALYGDPSAEGAVTQADVRAVGAQPDGAWDWDWWSLCRQKGIDPSGLAATLQCVDNVDELLVVQQLLYSAAAGLLWPGLVRRLPKMLRMRNTVVAAVALMVGSMASSRPVPWLLEHTGAVQEMTKTVECNPATAQVLDSIWGPLYHDLHAHAAALDVAQALQRCRERLFGADARSTLEGRHRVAQSLHGTASYPQALRQFWAVLRRQAVFLGEEDCDTLKTAAAMTNTLRTLGRHSEALDLSLRALRGRRRVLGRRHPLCAEAMRGAAWAMHGLGLHEDARGEFLRVWHELIDVVGLEHPLTLRAHAETAVAWAGMGDVECALRVRVGALGAYERVLGPHNPSTLKLVRDIGLTLRTLRRREESLGTFREVLALRTRALGLSHPATMEAMRDVSEALAVLARDSERLDMGRQLLAQQVDVFGDDHGEVLRTMRDMAAALARLGREGEAMQMERRMDVIADRIEKAQSKP